MSFEPLPPSSALLSLSGSVRGDARLPLGVDLNYFRKNFPAIQEEKIDKEDRFKPGSRAFFVKQNDGTCLQFECDGDVVYLVCLESPFSLGRAHAQQLLQPFANHSAWVFEPGGLNYQGYWVRDDKAAACTALFGSTEGTLWVYSAEFAEWLHKRDSAQN